MVALAVYKNPQWLSSSSHNKGLLIKEPEKVVLPQTKAKWRFIVWNSGACTETCRMQVDKLARIRLALGRRLYLVDEVLVLSDKATATDLPENFQAYLKENDIQLSFIAEEERKKHSLFGEGVKAFIVDPNHYLVLAYESNAQAADIFHDIGFLLQVDEKKNG
jgi:hypothetical protein